MGKTTKKKTPSRSRKDTSEVLQENPRRALFGTFYRTGGPNFRPGNAYRSAIAAGYSVATAKSNCHLLAREARVRTAEALEALGCDGFSQGAKLLQLREATTVKWNPAEEEFETFLDSDVQLRATQEINKIQGAYPDPAQGVENRPIQIVFPQNFTNLMPKTEAGD